MSAPQRLSPATFIKHASDVSYFYGFRPLSEIEKGLPGRRPRSLHTFATSLETCAARHALARSSEPVLAFYANTSPTFAPPGMRDSGEFGLHIVGSSDSLGEVMLLKTLLAILTEWGVTIARVRVNAVGDKDSKARFERELNLHLRKHAHLLDAPCRKALAESPLRAFGCTNEVCRGVLSDGPHSLSFLSEKSRSHFREMLEHIENLGFLYEVDPLLVGDEREPRIVFALDIDEDDATVQTSIGGRYDDYIRGLSMRKDATAVSAGIFFRKRGLTRITLSAPAASAPKIYFVQLGTRAKLQGLTVIDMLREAGVPLAQSFDPRSLAPQLECAREQGVKHLLIMGQREALDGTVIIRSTQNSSQHVIPINTLPRYLKSLKI